MMEFNKNLQTGSASDPVGKNWEQWHPNSPSGSQPKPRLFGRNAEIQKKDLRLNDGIFADSLK